MERSVLTAARAFRPRARRASLLAVQSALIFLVLLALAGPARAEGVALALNLPDANPMHRDFAAGIVSAAYERWRMLSPQLEPDEVVACQAEETCLLALAKGQGASHLLIVGVAGLGAADFVVSLKLLETKSGRELASFHDLATPGTNPRLAGATLAARAFEGVSGPPEPLEGAGALKAGPSEKAPSAPKRYDGLSPLAIGGWSTLGVAGAVALTGLAIGGIGTFHPALLGGPERLEALTLGTSLATGGLVAAGLALVVVDAFLPHEAPPEGPAVTDRGGSS